MKSRMNEKGIHIQHYVSVCGEIVLGSYEGRLCLCDWLREPHHRRVMNRLQRGLRAEYREMEDEVIRAAIRQLNDYFTGQLQRFDMPMMFVGTNFQQKIWQELQNIPYGQTVSYKEIASRVGMPEAVRAVANAVGANAMSIFVPCHRVVGSSGTLTGYAGGLAAKEYLLELESGCQGKGIQNKI